MLIGIVEGFVHVTWKVVWFTLFHTGYVWWRQAVMDWKVQIHMDLLYGSNKTSWPISGGVCVAQLQTPADEQTFLSK